MPAAPRGHRQRRPSDGREGRQLGAPADGEADVRLNALAIDVAERLRAREHARARWIGRDVLKELQPGTMRTRLAQRAGPSG